MKKKMNDSRLESVKTRSRSLLIPHFAQPHHQRSPLTFPLTSPMAEWKVMEPRKQDVEYYPDHNGDFFYIRVNDTGPNFRLVKAPVSDPIRTNWQELVPHRPDVMLDDTDFFKNYYIPTSGRMVCHRFVPPTFAAGSPERVEFPEPAYVATHTLITNMTPQNLGMAINRLLPHHRFSNTTYRTAIPPC